MDTEHTYQQAAGEAASWPRGGHAECVYNLVINILYLQCTLLAALKGTSIARQGDLL